LPLLSPFISFPPPPALPERGGDGWQETDVVGSVRGVDEAVGLFEEGAGQVLQDSEGVPCSVQFDGHLLQGDEPGAVEGTLLLLRKARRVRPPPRAASLRRFRF